MDDLNKFQYSAEFSADINNKMQMPTRLSVGPESDSLLHDTVTDARNSDFTSNPAHVMMNVPDRILLAGSGSHVGLKDSLRDLNLEDLPSFSSSKVELTTPPRTLTLEDVHFPTVGTEKNRPTPDSNGVGDNSAISDHTSGPLNLSDSVANITQLQQLKLLSQKVLKLEEQQVSREYRDNIFIAGLLVYVMYKSVRYFMN